MVKLLLGAESEVLLFKSTRRAEDVGRARFALQLQPHMQQMSAAVRGRQVSDSRVSSALRQLWAYIVPISASASREEFPSAQGQRGGCAFELSQI